MIQVEQYIMSHPFFLFERSTISRADNFLSASKRENMQQNNVYRNSKVKIKESLVSLVKPSFKIGDFALILTFPEISSQHSFHYQPNYSRTSTEMKRFLNLLDIAVFGKSLSKKKQLKAAFTFKLNSNNNIQVLMILQAPPKNLITKQEYVDLITNTWLKFYKLNTLSSLDVKELEKCQSWLELMFANATSYNSDTYADINWRLK